MDKISQQQFDRLVKLAPHELTEDDIAFLRARRTYLTPQHLDVFGKVLGLDEKPEKTAKK